ncbi:DUF2849 domain-containing protein [Salibaculum griseiflavum]|uniref:DUF2849 domain-containing protein n=1 Tax=Salibaculum griseiflavum TaxID=1914409 RepID=A0A2V1P6H3_9RHOB|nr:DUF2849 domain-containing protein [Salibaculum griseiflavum]PWG17414.1 DUF2849 domain-containing protein [Salibaculum griseiflavum]
MPRPFTPKVVTANRLLEGDAVWRTVTGDWSPRLSDAELIEDARTAELRLLEAAAEAHLVVGAYLADATKAETGPKPTHFREAFRTRGPSNYAHGKQADIQEKT